MKISQALWLSGLLLSSTVQAGEAESCQQVRLADVGWSDLNITNAMTRYLLSALGYETEVLRLSLPQTYDALAAGEADVFLGNWMPAQAKLSQPMVDAGAVERLHANLEGARYTLAVPQYVYEAGVKNFADIARFAERFDRTIYGIEPGNDGNALVKKMIASNAFGLGDFRLDESSEQGMLTQVRMKELLDRQWIVFLGWEPHPMNVRHKLAYLDGGDDYFGPNQGGATVYTVVRKGYAQQCPNVARLLGNLEFSLDMENQLMDRVLNEKDNPRRAVRNWLKRNPERLDAWLKGVATRGGAPGNVAVKASLAN
ncbi:MULTISPECIES: choline ABC transporter substrate-binding protein [Pseudomonas]|uniref:choline ABC transporter substrate-binding protein n=1 Tax=Pseudomonas TaxID=286 RepID=UPI00031F26EE|nr:MULTISPECIES: choline ABC transporter substrate-binding protein [Pseudomonas]KXJ31103.1 glycine/betaine ABC transporter substrate-binding protein [Pseudomonas sp. HUK17]MDC7828995.1 choline ABC transporter substrate-binding protein [Pseudomonas benzopyrenica]MXS17966.1 choline ABC transporter substrate-binding protein [Pseudomonas oryzihabitans]NRH42725.1 choline ABC transporter substrate-binding protein [Pseudomonas sp. MS15a(2019)]